MKLSYDITIMAARPRGCFLRAIQGVSVTKGYQYNGFDLFLDWNWVKSSTIWVKEEKNLNRIGFCFPLYEVCFHYILLYYSFIYLVIFFIRRLRTAAGLK